MRRAHRGCSHARDDLIFERKLELIECCIDLGGCSTLLVDLRDAPLEVDAAFERTQYFIARAKHFVKQLELLREQLVDTLVGGVPQIDEIQTTTSCFCP